MKTIDISKHIGPVEVFDDPEYCSKGSKLCNRFGQYDEDAWCWIFDDGDGPHTKLEYDDSKNKFRKCPQCKAAYQKAKQQTEEYCGIMAAKSCECEPFQGCEVCGEPEIKNDGSKFGNSKFGA